MSPLGGKAGVQLGAFRRAAGEREQFKQHASWASLGLAPVASAPASRLAQLADNVLDRLGVSVSSSLFSFKGKFQPHWEPRYLVAEHLWDWPALATATFLVHYPAVDARARRFAPALAGRIPARFAAGLAVALVAVGMSGILAAAGQSKQGHPLYSAHVAANQVAAALPFTGVRVAAPASHSVPQKRHGQPVTAHAPKPAAPAGHSVPQKRHGQPVTAHAPKPSVTTHRTTLASSNSGRVSTGHQAKAIFVEAKRVIHERKKDPAPKPPTHRHR